MIKKPQWTMANHFQDFTENSFDDPDIHKFGDKSAPEFHLSAKRSYPFRCSDVPAKKQTSPMLGSHWNLQLLSQAANEMQGGGKSPVSVLNEMSVRATYDLVRQEGPPHCPSFTVTVTVADMSFEGWGHSKRDARASAAAACLNTLMQRAGRVFPLSGSKDFTRDDNGTDSKAPPAENTQKEVTLTTTPLLKFTAKEQPRRNSVPASSGQTSSAAVSANGTAGPSTPPAPASAPPGPSASMLLFGATTTGSHKSAINILYESYPKVVFTCTHGDGTPLNEKPTDEFMGHNMRFKVVCTVKNQNYEGFGSSKKQAKLAAARGALSALGAGSPAATAVDPAEALSQQSHPIYDTVARLVNEKFNELMRGDLVHSKRKVLAGIVISDIEDTEDVRVIAVTTGTKCVIGSYLSMVGRAINDCHAEVLARRCLQRYLYAQLFRYTQVQNPREPIPECDVVPAPGGGYMLRETRRLHLYISTAPCGDARIFSPHESQPDRHPNRMARGQLRTKIESGEGTIPVKNSESVQTWDGVMQGSRLLTMSCSDKLARWCVSGAQGALLSRLIAPIYFHSVVLGSMLNTQHAQRALYKRVEGHLGALPPPFRLQRPALACSTSTTESRMPQRAPNFAVAWTCTDQVPEIVLATSGKLESGQPSLLCKQSMFARWLHLVQRLPVMPQAQPIPESLDNLIYFEAKQLCPSYQSSKVLLNTAFDSASLGRWVRKPIEQDQFTCELMDADTGALFA